MDVASYLRCFEESLSSYSGDDPLDPWDKFVDFLQKRQSVEGSSEMSLVFDALVQRFLDVDRYANDPRYVNYCIRCASFYSDPVALFAHVFSKGVGTRTAALYLAWARQFEQKGMREQADAVFQKALENQAQPADVVLHEYGQFQSRAQPPPSGAGAPLQNSQLTNQTSPHTLAQNKAPPPADCPSKPPPNRTVITVSRSETSAALPSDQSAAVPTVSEYSKDELACEGSELSFEEVRAHKYFRKIREKQERERIETVEKTLRQQEAELQELHSVLQQVNQGLEACGGFPCPTESQQVRLRRLRVTSAELTMEQDGCQKDGGVVDQRSHQTQPAPNLKMEKESGATASGEASQPVTFNPFQSSSTRPRASIRRSLALRSQPDLSLIQEASLCPPGRIERSDRWLAGAAAAHFAPLDGGLEPELEDTLDVSQSGPTNVSHMTPNSSLGLVQATPSRALPSPTVNTREALGLIMDMFQAPTFLDEPFQGATMLVHTAEKELETSVLPAPPAPAPFTIFQDDEDKENGSAAAPAGKSKPVRTLAEVGGVKADKPYETPSDLAPDESTTWGARYNSLNSLAACPNSTTDFALLAQFVSTPFTHKTPLGGGFFPAEESNGDGADDENVFTRRQSKKLSPIMEQSPCDDPMSERAAPPSSARQGTIMCDGSTSGSLSMMQPPPPAALSFRDQTLGPAESSKPLRPRSEPFHILEDAMMPADPEPGQGRVSDVPMSPGGALVEASWLQATEPDLDAFLRPCQPSEAPEVPMSPAPPPQLPADVPMSPARQAPPLVSDPWDSELISALLSGLGAPLTSHPCCITWPCDVPRISPKITLSMGSASLRVDCVLGEGAFATVFQATDPVTSEKVVLKVQKPANPWEFYINTCLDARLPPAVRHLFSSIRSAHLFQNGSVMVGEMHSYSTLLNAVNIYRTLGAKVMPPPLVLYFTVCILHTVEQLHAARLIHADIKPDNFMLGESFLENRCFDPDSADHGLVLIDLGQSIDMQLFPEGTAFTARCLTSGFQCTEMMSGKPWSYQIDYFGIAGTVYCLLFGTYMQVTNEGGRWKTNGVFRRNPHSDLWLDFFDTLLNVPDCGSLPSLQSVRYRLSAVLQQNYGSKLAALKSRLVIQLLESHRAARR